VNKPKIEIRQAKPSDARQLNRYIRTIFQGSEHLITRPDEFATGPFKQRLWIAKKQVNPVEACFIALQGKRIIAMLDNWTDRRKRVTHSTCFAMSVAEGYRGMGIGYHLLNHFIDWVQKHPSLTRIELHVHSDNKHAVKLYKRCGFELEGTRKGAIRYEDGRVVDDHIMALWPSK
jgi:RimJ/RimL family protein N-acetyltransferase